MLICCYAREMFCGLSNFTRLGRSWHGGHIMNVVNEMLYLNYSVAFCCLVLVSHVWFLCLSG